jgi:hypothetical protein
MFHVEHSCVPLAARGAAGPLGVPRGTFEDGSRQLRSHEGGDKATHPSQCAPVQSKGILRPNKCHYFGSGLEALNPRCSTWNKMRLATDDF